jgi:hypothetical protein
LICPTIVCACAEAIADPIEVTEMVKHQHVEEGEAHFDFQN